MSRKTKSLGGRGVQLHPPLWEKEGALKRDEVQCPICWSILIQPVTMPCRHALCLECFKKHVEETSLQCPCCRMRLSVWSRKANKDDKLIDTKLWNRIQKEFPKLVDTRLCGQDSQALEPLDLISLADREESNDSYVVNEEDTVEELTPIRNGVIDGVMSACKGDIKRELEAMVKQHQDDIENERRQEEIASSELIKQLQDAGEVPQPVDPSTIATDLEIAKKLAQQLEEDFKATRLAEINASRKMFAMPSQTPPNKSASSSRIEGWVNGSQSQVKPLSGNSTCLNNLQTPKKRPSTSSLSSHSEKKPKSNSNRTSLSQTFGSVRGTRSKSKTSRDIQCKTEQPSRAENSILSYLSPVSANSSGHFSQSSSNPLFDSRQQITLKTETDKCLAVFTDHPETKEFCGSAFSPSSSRLMIPRQALVYSSPFRQERLINMKTVQISTSSDAENERDILTPNSIDCEVNTHFRPIRSAPKTPPKRLPDGSYLPDPPIVTSLPARIILMTDSQPSASCSEVTDGTQTKSPGKISLLEGKRNSNDSGRGSSSPEQRVNKYPNIPTTPPIPQLVHFLSIPTTTYSSIEAPIISPEGLRCVSHTSTLPRALDCNSTAPKVSNPSVIIKEEPVDVVDTAVPGSSKAMNNYVSVKQEPIGEFADEEANNNVFMMENDEEITKPHNQTSVKEEPVSDHENEFIDIDEASLSLILEESVLDVQAVTPVRKISKSLVEQEQEKEFKRIQERSKQMEADKKLAEKLQKMLNQGRNVAPPRSYSLRSWVTRTSH